jgi:O-antigen/teichoic acid export membrane protein
MCESVVEKLTIQLMPSNTTRIAKNILALYFRQMITMLVSLYTVRVVLNTLGVVDYGIYNVVAGVTTMFSFLDGSMSAAAQRFLSFELGKNNLKQYNRIFCLCMNIYLIIIIISTLLLETIGLWFLNTKLVIPAERMSAARFIFHCTVFSFAFTIIESVYNAAVVSHERMTIFAVMGIIDAILKLAIIFLLPLFSIDKLQFYGTLISSITFLHVALYWIICRKLFPECRYRFFWNTELFKKIFSFSGWAIGGGISVVLYNQGINILLNIFFGPLINAARGIAYQVNSVLTAFTNNISTAIRPRMIKQYAENKYSEMFSLAFIGTRIIYYLNLFFVIPVFLEISFILTIWLKQVPEYTVLFLRLILICSLIECLKYPLLTIIYATGNIKKYELMVYETYLLIVPLSYLFFKLGFPPQTPMVLGIVIAVVTFGGRVHIVRGLVDFPVKQYFKTILPLFLVSILAAIPPVVLSIVIGPGLIHLLAVCGISVISWGVSVYCIGLKTGERTMLVNRAIHILRHRGTMK